MRCGRWRLVFLLLLILRKKQLDHGQNDSKQLEPGWVQGLDPFAEWNGEHDDLISNSGIGKRRYPQEPVCMLNGIAMPTMCCCSESGSITAELLVAMLQQIDLSGVFDRNDGVYPFLILDGHGSRFDLTFLEYINSPINPCNVCIGVPYGTSYWQVGDSTEQNGCFKMCFTMQREIYLLRRLFTICLMQLKRQMLLELFRMHGTRVLQQSEQIKKRFWIGAGDHLITMHCFVQKYR